MIVQKDNLIGGIIQTADKFFSIIPYKDNNAFLLEHDPVRASEFVCGNDNGRGTTTASVDIDPCNTDIHNCEATIDALVLVTPEVSDFFASLGNPFIGLIATAIGLESVNWAFQNSDIPLNRVRYSIQAYDFQFNVPLNIRFDIRDLEADPEVQALRNEFRADVVIMLTDHNYLPVLGIVDDIGNPDNEAAFAIVEVPFLLGPRWTFAHEFGHLFGARHNRSPNVPCPNIFPQCGDDTNICSHGFRFVDNTGTVQRTLLAATNALGVNDFATGRMLNYSNPNVLINGVPTGTPDEDNARSVSNMGCIVSSYRVDASFGATISTISHACESDDNFLVYANVREAADGFPGHPPYTYSWSVSGCGNGINPIGGGAVAGVQFSCPGGGIVNVNYRYFF